MSNFFQLSDLEKQKIKEAKDEITIISNELFTLVGKTFEDTTELERQVLSAFCFGIINAIVMSKELGPIQAHTVTTTLLMDVFKYSEQQAEDFTQELINSTDEEYHPVMFSIIRRGINGYYQYVNKQTDDLKLNILDVLNIVNKRA